jgi:hypothetical protein
MYKGRTKRFKQDWRQNGGKSLMSQSVRDLAHLLFLKAKRATIGLKLVNKLLLILLLYKT